MSEHGKNPHHGHKHGQHGHEHQEQSYLEHGRKAWQWHKDWRTWFGVILMLAAMFAYWITLDESLPPGEPREQGMPATP